MRSSGAERYGSVSRARRLLTAALVPTAALMLTAACGRGSLTSDTATSSVLPAPVTAPAVAPNTISISGFAFGPPVTVMPGQVVTVLNADQSPHTVTADDKRSFDAQVAANGRSFFMAPTKPGTYRFTCTIHPDMHGTLIVR